MNIFILEDDGDRCKNFSKTFVDDNMVISNNAETGVMLLNSYKFDYIFLDHDLGGVTYVDITNKNTGSWLCENLNDMNKDTPIIIHSWNPVGARNMKSILVFDKCFTDVKEVRFNQNMLAVNGGLK